MFSYPVDKTHPIKTYYGQKGQHYMQYLDPDNGLWVPGKDQDGYGNSCGVDFNCPAGTLVHAMADGFIVRASPENAIDRSGLHILQLVSMPGFDSWMLKYSNLQLVYVRPGDRVNRQDNLAQSSDPGLHVDLMSIRGRQWKPIPFDS